MTDKEKLLDILGDFSACSCNPEKMDNGHEYTELCLTGGWLALEFDESGKLIDAVVSS